LARVGKAWRSGGKLCEKAVRESECSGESGGGGKEATAIEQA